jgi:hypothetical protein
MKKTKLHSKNFLTYWLIAFALAFAIASCTSTKDLDKSNESNLEERKIDSASYWKQKHDQLKFKLEEEQKEFHSALLFQEDNANSIIDAYQQVKDLLSEKELSEEAINARLHEIFDSLKNNPCRNSITTNANGSFTATGVKSANLDLFVMNSKLQLATDNLETEINKRMKLEEELKTERSQKKVVKETKVLSSWWMWYLAGCITIIAIAVWLKHKMRIKEFINQLKNKL